MPPPDPTGPLPAADPDATRPPLADAATLPPDIDGANTLPPPDVAATFPPPVPSASDHNTPPAPPGYEITGELGRGGMGVVYKARQVRLNRAAALKMVIGADPRERTRFLAEAEAVAAVRHPGVVQVYEYGEYVGRPFLAMEFLPGGSLSDRLAAGPLPPKPAAELLGTLAAAVQAAHDAGIVHRDLKPGNVLYDENGSPKVTDFGLAKRATGSDLTKTNAVMGTPAYMAPEQARGRTKFVGPGADVYALGVILFECLTGRPPFRGDDAVDLLMRVATEEAPSSRSLAPAVPRDLDLVCRKCLAKEPHERYATAAELAADLARFAAGEPVTVRAAGVVERAAKWARRNPTRAAAYGLTLLVAGLIGVAAVVGSLWRRAEGERDANLRLLGELSIEHNKSINALARETLALGAAEAARDGERRAREGVVAIGYARNVDLAYREYQAENLSRARTLLAACPAELRGWEWRYVHRLCEADPVAFVGHAGVVTAAAYFPDGARVVTASEDRTARVWDEATGAERFRVPLGGPAWAVAVSADGKRFTTGAGGEVAVWNAATGANVVRYPAGMSVNGTVAFSPDGGKLIAAGENTAAIWSVAGGELVRIEFAGNKDRPNRPAFTPEGDRLLYLAKDGKAVKSRNLATGAEAVVVAAPADTWFARAAFSPDGERIAIATRANSPTASIRLWDAAGKRVATLGGWCTDYAIEFGPDGRWILAAGFGDAAGDTRIWSAATGAERVVLRGAHRGAPGATFVDYVAGFGPDGRHVLTGEGVAGYPVRVWNATAGKAVAVLKGRTQKRVVLRPDGGAVLAWGESVWPQVWPLPGGAEWAVRNVEPGDANPPQAALRGRPVRVVSEVGGRVTVEDEWNGKVRVVLDGHTAPGVTWAFAPDGTRVATGGNDGTVRVWEVPGGKELHRFPLPEANRMVCWSQDGRLLAAAGAGDVVKVWDAGDGREVATVTGVPSIDGREHSHPGGDGVWFAPAANRVVVVAWTRGYVVWDLATGTLAAKIEPRQACAAVAVSPDGARLATVFHDATVMVWDATLGLEYLALTLPLPPARGLLDVELTSQKFTPDGARLIAVLADDTAVVWDATPLRRPREAAPPPRPAR